MRDVRVLQRAAQCTASFETLGPGISNFVFGTANKGFGNFGNFVTSFLRPDAVVCVRHFPPLFTPSIAPVRHLKSLIVLNKRHSGGLGVVGSNPAAPTNYLKGLGKTPGHG